MVSTPATYQQNRGSRAPNSRVYLELVALILSAPCKPLCAISEDGMEKVGQRGPDRMLTSSQDETLATGGRIVQSGIGLPSALVSQVVGGDDRANCA